MPSSSQFHESIVMPPKKKVNTRTFDDTTSNTSNPIETPPETIELIQTPKTVRTYRVRAGVVLYSWSPQREKRMGELITSDEFNPPASMTVAQLEKHYLDLKWIELL